ncbi:MAG: zinc ribbon domain-containing protein [Clostridia bacterium]|nr:zinc ribbon domain-containing protein [Clostridia bacterium]
MFCQKCGAQIPDDSTFCRKCGNPVKGKSAAGSPIVTNLVEGLKAFFTGKWENGIMSAAQSKSHEWAILLGCNVLLFSLAGGVFGAVRNIGFGFPFLFGFIISLVANIIMFGALYAVLALMRKTLPIFSMLNLYAFTTLPLTVAALAAMPLAPAWHMFATFFLAIAVLTQVLMVYMASKKAAGDGRMNIAPFVIVIACAVLVLAICAYWLSYAATASYIKAEYGEDALDAIKALSSLDL